MMKRHMILLVSACCLVVIVGCNKKSRRPQEPSDSDGVPTAHEVLVVDVEEKIVPLPEEPKPAAPAAPAKPGKKPAAAPPSAPKAAATPAPPPAPKKVTTAKPAKPNPLKAAVDKKDVLKVAEDTPRRATPKKKTKKPPAPKPKLKSESSADKTDTEDDEPEDDASADPEVKAVQTTLVAFAKSVETSDTKTFKENLSYTKADEPVLKIMWAMVTEMNGLEKDMAKAYGQKGVDAVKKNQQMRIGASVPSVEDIRNKMKVKVTGNKAKATIPGQARPMSLVKANGKWKVQLFKPGEMQGPQAQFALAIMTASVKGIKNARKKIGKPGYTPEKVMQEVSKSMTPGPAMMPKNMKLPKGVKLPKGMKK